jgi:hypothetical protein
MTIDEMDAVMQGVKAGKTIQRRQGVSEWRDAYVTPWSLIPCEFRVKPEPLELVVNLYGDNCGFAYTTRTMAEMNAGPTRVRCVHMREVLPQ